MAEFMLCEIRLAEDVSRQSPGRLVGTLITYEKRASDRPEIFARGSLRWRPSGIIIDDMHERKAPILRVIPFMDGDEVKIDHPLPDTTRGRDAAVGVREGVYGGLSVQFHAESEGRRGGLREIRRALLVRAGLVDLPSYADSLVEVREGLTVPVPVWQQQPELLRWL